MNNLKLTKLNSPNGKKLNEMISALKDFLNEEVDSKNTQWMENLNTILDFQDDDDSFKIFSTYEIPSDARVMYCHKPTYICSSILMKAYLTGDSTLREKIEEPLTQGLERCCMRGLRGHGYEALLEQIGALNIFMKGGLREFIDLYPELNSRFTEMILNIMVEFDAREEQEAFRGPWGDDYKEDILKINEYFATRKVFVYGTLMKGEPNHRFLEDSKFLGVTALEGYEMYNVRWYPAIVPGESTIPGELYEVPEMDIKYLDGLEGEGSLYIRKCKETTDKSLAYIYEYAQDTSDLEKIDSWKDYVWYVAYGSNMLFESFKRYIKGGSSEYGGSPKTACRDTTLPIEERAIDIQYDMYFGNESTSWNGSGVSFLDTSKKGHALGVAYLITREQFDHVAAQENNGRFPGNGEWYNCKKSLGKMDGYEMLTVTNDGLCKLNKPSEEYLIPLKLGIKKNWSEMSEEDINDYLDSCIRD